MIDEKMENNENNLNDHTTSVNEKENEIKQDKAKKEKIKPNSTAILMFVFTIVLLALPFLTMFIYAMAVGVKASKLMPYYSFWPFLGALFLIVVAIPYIISVPLILRPKSKSSARTQTIKVGVAYFGILLVLVLALDYVLPNQIREATQKTLLMEDIYYNTDQQIEAIGKLDRKYFMTTITAGAYDPTIGYEALSTPTEGLIDHKKGDPITGYKNEFIDATYRKYADNETLVSNTLKGFNSRQKEFFDYLYTNHVLRDMDYSLKSGEEGVRKRRAIALAVFEKQYPVFEKICKVGFKDKKMKQLREQNFASLDKDGYQTFLDPGISYAQAEGRQTPGMLFRLIANPRNEKTYAVDAHGNKIDPIKDADKQVGWHGHLFMTSDMKLLEEYKRAGGEFRNGKSVDFVKSKGRIIHENGQVEVAMKWTVLDMDGKAQTLVKKDLNSLKVAGLEVGNIVKGLLDSSTVVQTLNQLLEGTPDGNGVSKIVQMLSGGAKLGINPYLDDDGVLNVDLYPQSAKVGQLGYQDASWLNSSAQLLGVINLTAVRRNVYIVGAIGFLMVIGACVLREERLNMKAKKGIQ